MTEEADETLKITVDYLRRIFALSYAYSVLMADLRVCGYKVTCWLPFPRKIRLRTGTHYGTSMLFPEPQPIL